MRTFRFLVGAAILFASGCQQDQGDQSLTSSPNPERWELSSDPVLMIGGVDSGVASDLHRIRATLRLRDGTIVVADAGQRLLYFDSSGSPIRTIGRSGSGPAEFRNLMRVQLLEGDSLLAYDDNLRRATLLDPDGEVVRTVTWRPGVLLGRLPDGTFIGRTRAGTAIPEHGKVTVEFNFDLDRVAPDGGVLSRILSTPGEQAVTVPSARVPPHLGWPLRVTQVAVGADEIYVAPGDRMEVSVFTPDGDLKRVMRADHQPAPMQPAELLQNLSPLAQSRLRPQDLEPMADDLTFPAITALRVDDAGYLWVKRGVTAPGEPSEWLVFNREGEHIALVDLPARYDPFHVGDNFILGVWRDDLSIEYVRLYGLSRHEQ
jgi:hypothetical protein